MPDDPVYQIEEEESGLYEATITGDDMVTPLPGSTLTTLVLTVYVVKSDGTEAVVNTRNQQNVLNTNNVAVTEAGRLTWNIQPEDTIIVEDHLKYERHYCLFEWTWPALTGTHAGKHLFILNVRNLRRVS